VYLLATYQTFPYVENIPQPFAHSDSSHCPGGKCGSRSRPGQQSLQPPGDGGFARDYALQLNAGDQIAIEVTSDNFDTVVLLLTKDGKTLGKNDDGPDGTSNSLLFSRIKKTGTYTIRVQGFSDTSGGKFTLKVSKLAPQP
jgi:hypothetical protein